MSSVLDEFKLHKNCQTGLPQVRDAELQLPWEELAKGQVAGIPRYLQITLQSQFTKGSSHERGWLKGKDWALENGETRNGDWKSKTQEKTQKLPKSF